MRDNVRILYVKAEKAKSLYKMGLITREQCKADVMPYIDECNKTAKELAIKFKQQPKLIKFQSYIR